MKTSKLSLNRIRNITVLFLFLSFVGCATISSFDQQAYTQTTSLKVDALNIMDLAKKDYSSHGQAIKDFQTLLDKAYEYEKNRPKNEITIKLWDKLLDTEGHLLGGFIKRWESEEKLGGTYHRSKETCR